MEIVICRLTLEEVDSSLKDYLTLQCADDQVLVAKCIGCCGECASTFVVLADGTPIVAKSREELLARLKAEHGSGD